MEAKCDIKMKVIWVKTRAQHSVPGGSTCQGAAGLQRNAAKVTAVPQSHSWHDEKSVGRGHAAWDQVSHLKLLTPVSDVGQFQAGKRLCRYTVG